MFMNNRNNFAIPALMLLAIPIVLMSYFLIKWAYSSGFMRWIEGVLSNFFARLLVLAIEILQKAFV